jgi:putative SOS response-associated peptidase YedK
MCGRVRLSSDYSEIRIRLKFAPNSVAPNFEPDWNKPPTAPMLVAIRSVNGERVPKMMKWGLIPHWAKDDKLQYSTFNARAEEFTTKPAFRDVWKRSQRCLVVTDGFYEWKKLDEKGKLKQAPRHCHGRRHTNGDGWSVGEMEITDKWRRSFKLHDFNV